MPENATSNAKTVEQYIADICEYLSKQSYISQISDLVDQVFAALPTPTRTTDSNYVAAHAQVKHQLAERLVGLLDNPKSWLDGTQPATEELSKLKREVQQTKTIMNIAINVCEFMNKQGLSWRIADFGIMQGDHFTGPYVDIYTTREKWTFSFDLEGEMLVGTDIMKPQPVPDVSSVFIRTYVYGLYQLHLLSAAERQAMPYLFRHEPPAY
jgi:hypothetical protein